MAAILLQRYSASQHAGHCPKHAPCAQAVHTRGHVAATYPWDKYPQHFHVCANVLILSLLRSPCPATCPCCMSPQCVLHKFVVAATCRCDMSLQHDPSCLPIYSCNSCKPYYDNSLHSSVRALRPCLHVVPGHCLSIAFFVPTARVLIWAPCPGMHA